MQDLNDLYYFVQVVDHRGFAPAGRALGLQKSKLSRRIQHLEDSLGVRLLNRSSRRFSVTDLETLRRDPYAVYARKILQLQPIEFLKPFFVVTTAYLFAFRFEDRSLPVLKVGAVLLLPIVTLLVLQPDFGQSALVIAVWLVQAVLAGLPLLALGTLILLSLGGLAIAYQFEPHIQARIDGFLHGEGDTYQVDRALDCFRSGGLYGTGPGEGVAKFRLPEAHTDYIFSVIGEEFGAIACFALALLYLAVILRVLLQMLDEDDPFTLIAATGLVAQFGGQAFINMSVNLALLPSKGMTLPLVSHGGSSFLATSVAMGLLLAITRRNRYLKASPYLAPGVALP